METTVAGKLAIIGLVFVRGVFSDRRLRNRQIVTVVTVRGIVDHKEF
jgi:hypothetical protein